jgi:hypothetical protein
MREKKDGNFLLTITLQIKNLFYENMCAAAEPVLCKRRT